MSKTECEHPDDCTYLCGKCGKVAGCLLCDTVAHTYFECKGKREETRVLGSVSVVMKDGTKRAATAQDLQDLNEPQEEGLFDQPPTMEVKEMPPVDTSSTRILPDAELVESIRTGPSMVTTPMLNAFHVVGVEPVGKLKTGPVYSRDALLAYWASLV